MAFGFGFALTAIAKAVGFSPSSLFASGSQGAWYDPSDYTTLFEDSAGTTPITTPLEKPVGLMLDKSKGLVLGSNVVINGSFSADTNWSKGTGWSISGGKANASSAAGFLAQTNAGSLAVGKVYKVTFTVSNYASGSVKPYVGYNPTYGVAVSSNGTFSQYLRHTDASTVEYGMYSNTSFTGSVDDISIQEVTGNHAYQSTSTSRPTLSARYNLLTKTEDFTDSVWKFSNTGTTTVGNQSVAPDGTQSADQIKEDTSTGVHRIFGYSADWAITTGVSYKFVVHAKANGRTKFALSSNNLGLGSGVDFDLVAKTAGTNGSITELSGGWFRCQITGTATGSPFYVTVDLKDASGASYTGDGTSGIYIWGADLRVANDGIGLPAYQRVNTATDYDYAGFPAYVRFDGVDDGMVTNSIDFSATDKMFVAAGVRKTATSTSAGLICELSAIWYQNNGTFVLYGPDGTAQNYGAGSRGSSGTSYVFPVFASPLSNVVTVLGSISGDLTQLRVNSSVAATDNTTDQGTGNYGNYPLYIGRRGGSTLPFSGRIYSLIVCGKQLSASEITSMENWVNGKVKAY